MKPYYFEVLGGVRRNRGDDWTNLSHDEKCLLVGALLKDLHDRYKLDSLDRMLTNGGMEAVASHLMFQCDGHYVGILRAIEDAMLEEYGFYIAYDLEHPGEPSQFAGQFKDLV